MEPIKSGKNSSRWSKSIRGGQNLPEGVILIGSGQNPSEVVKIYQRGSNLIGGGMNPSKMFSLPLWHTQFHPFWSKDPDAK